LDNVGEGWIVRIVTLFSSLASIIPFEMPSTSLPGFESWRCGGITAWSCLPLGIHDEGSLRRGRAMKVSEIGDSEGWRTGKVAAKMGRIVDNSNRQM